MICREWRYSIEGRRQAQTLAHFVMRRMFNAIPAEGQLAIRRFRNRQRPLPQLSIGVLSGEDPWSLEERDEYPYPILTAEDVTDAHAAFVADPFAIHHDGTWHLFFEVMNRDSGKGEIGHASSRDLVDWDYQGLVLVEPFHLSYPGVYVMDDGVWMVPETWEAKQVRLYRADRFQTRWVLDRVLIDGVAGTDPTLFRRPEGGWSMLLCAAEGAHNETLRRFDAVSLVGPWTEATESPLIVADPGQARPGGHCFSFDGIQYRLGQDCSRRYGERLRSFPMTPPWWAGAGDVLAATGDGWRARGGHHADIHIEQTGGVVAFVDGEA